ncbi:hypothetical protein RUM43_005231 [Polyplax serrata]|uniref:Uncharacterized protein n=1 Tax=Polyplax serrata TaxID=468196 RepID=A0AAN8XPJ6_POLSC
MYSDKNLVLPNVLCADFTCSSTFHSTDLKGQVVKSLSVFYLGENHTHRRYYLALSTLGTLLVIGRNDTDLQIISSHKNVREYRVFDFKALGYPQIEVSFLDSTTSILNSSGCICNTTTGSPKTTSFNFKYSHLVKSMEEKLQMVNAHINELTHESVEMGNLFDKRTALSAHDTSPTVPVKLSSWSDRSTCSGLTIVKTWIKSLGKSLIIGIRFINKSHRILKDVHLVLSGKKIKRFTYCFFKISGDSDLLERSECFLLPRQELLVVGVLKTPALTLESSLSVKCSLGCPTFKTSITVDTLSVKAVDMITGCKRGFLSADDVMDVVITHEEVNLLVDTENCEQNLVTPALMNLGFQECECRGWKFHYNRTIEMGIVLSKHRTRPTVYNLTAYTR